MLTYDVCFVPQLKRFMIYFYFYKMLTEFSVSFPNFSLSCLPLWVTSSEVLKTVDSSSERTAPSDD
jgi:hypothetical protein